MDISLIFISKYKHLHIIKVISPLATLKS